MNVRHACCFLGLLIIGCGDSVEDHQIVEQTVTVRNSSGEEKTVPLSELYDPSSGAPAFNTVLVVDRQWNRKGFVSPDQLKGQTPTNARYVLVTSSPETFEADE